jgi:hypothetical protein
MKYMAMTATLVGLMLASTGCQEEKAEAPADPAAEAPAEKSAEPAQPQPEEPAEPNLSKSAERRLRLEASFTALYCAQKSNEGGDRIALYKEHGFNSPAAWSKAWHSAARSDVDWANQIVSKTLSSDCKATP